MGIRKTSLIIAAVSSLIIVVLLTIFIHAERRALSRLDAHHHRNTELAKLTNNSLFHFKRQVQEWKNLLLRGRNTQDFDTYWQLFEDEERNTRAQATQLVDALAELPELQTKARRFVAMHESLGGRYRAALALYDKLDPNSAFNVDATVRGIDREPAKLIDTLAGEIASTTNVMHEQLDSEIQRDLALQGYVSAGAILVWIICSAWLLTRTVIKPLTIATAVAGRMSTGKYDTPVASGHRGEVGLLLRTMSAMQQRILDDTAAMTRQHEELQVSYRQAQAANEAKNRFLSIVSHEFRTPLNGIEGARQLLEAAPHTAEQRDMLEIIELSSSNLLRLVDRMLLYVDLEKDSYDSGRETIDDPARWLHTATAQCKEHAQKKGLLIEEEYDFPAGTTLTLSKRTLSVAVRELLDNAVTFSTRGTIQVRAYLTDGVGAHATLRIEITDQGIGIAPDKLAYITEHFTQGDDSSARPFGGLGLGLALCQRIALVTGSRLTIDSTPNLGTQAHLEVPVNIAAVNSSQPLLASRS